MQKIRNTSTAQNRLADAVFALKAAREALPVGALAQTQITRALSAALMAQGDCRAEGR